MSESASAARVMRVLPYVAAAVPFAVIAARGVPEGDDLPFELTRIASYAHALGDGQWPPYWGGDLYAGYGSPIFLFYGHAYLLVASGLGLALGSWATASWLALALFAGVAVFGMQRAARAATQELAAARIASYVLVLHPYLLGNALLRNANAEYAALCSMPIALYGVLLLARDPPRGALVLALGLAAVISAHTLSSLVVCGLVACVALAWLRARAAWLWALAAGALGLSLSAFVWLPALALKDSVRSAELVQGKFDFHHQFRPLHTLFDGSAFHSAGPLPLVVLLAAFWALARAPRGGRALIAALIAAFVALVALQLPLSLGLWEALPWLAYFQFPFRFQGPLALATALLAALAFTALAGRATPRVRLGLELLVLATCVLCAVPQLARMQPLPASRAALLARALEPVAMRRVMHSATVRDEYLPIDALRALAEVPAATRTALSQDQGVRLRVLHDAPRRLELEVRAERASTLCLARWAFDFWSVEVDGEAQPIARGKPGCLIAQVPAGTHVVRARLTPPPLRVLGLALGAAGALACGLIHARQQRRRPV